VPGRGALLRNCSTLVATSGRVCAAVRISSYLSDVSPCFSTAAVVSRSACCSWAQSESAPSEQTTSYSDTELKSFAAAAVEVHRIFAAFVFFALVP
jgi:hypothetical protein